MKFLIKHKAERGFRSKKAHCLGFRFDSFLVPLLSICDVFETCQQQCHGNTRETSKEQYIHAEQLVLYRMDVLNALESSALQQHQ